MKNVALRSWCVERAWRLEKNPCLRKSRGRVCIATVSRQEGSYAFIRATAAGFRDDIAMLEDGCMLFTFVRMKSKPRHHTIHEEYVDEEAHEAHSQTKHYALWNAIRAQTYRMKVESFEVTEEIEPAGR